MSTTAKIICLLIIISLIIGARFFISQQASNYDVDQQSASTEQLEKPKTETELERITRQSKPLYVQLLTDRERILKKLGHPDNLSSRQLLLNKEFEALHAEITVYQKQFEQDITKEIIFESFFRETFYLPNPEYGALLDEWVSLNPNSYIPYLARGYYLLGMGWHARSAAPARGILPQSRRDMKHYHQLAVQDFDKVIELNPNMTIAYAEKLSIAKNLGDDELKLTTLQAGLAINPASYSIRKSYLFVLDPRWGGNRKAIADFLKDTKQYEATNSNLIPLGGFSHYTNSQTQYYKSYYKSAKDLINKALEYGDKSWYHHQLGLIHYFLIEYDLAIAAHTRAIELYPNEQDYFLWRASAYTKKDMFAEAFANIDLAEQLNPYSFDYLKERGDFLIEIKEFKEGIEYYKQAVSLKKDCNSARTWSLIAYHTAFSLDDYENAKDAYEIAITLKPSNAKNLYDYALVLNKTQDCKVFSVLQRYENLCAGEEGLKHGCFVDGVKWAGEMIKHKDKLPECADKIDERAYLPNPNALSC